MSPPDVLIIGAGLAGLTCARHLHRAGIATQLLEASNDIGGRIRSDNLGGYTLDRGFQVLLTAYPEAQRQLDYDRLNLHSFYNGALIRFDGRFHRMADPFRHLLDATGTILSPIGTFKDKFRVARLRTDLVEGTLRDLFAREEMTTDSALRERYHFSDNIIDRFFRPFFGGIFFDKELRTSSRMFDFVFRMFALGSEALPATGMQAIPRQIAAALPDKVIRLNTLVAAVDHTTVHLENEEPLSVAAVVIATEAPVASRLLGVEASVGHNSTTCLYYAADTLPEEDPILILNGEGEGPINNVNLLSNVVPSYAPEDKALLSVTLIGDLEVPDDTLESQVRRQLAEWFGPEVGTWTHLKTYRIAYALPDQAPPFLARRERPPRRRPGLYVCGDHLATASINGALRSGRCAAEAVLEDLNV
ncbi:MAG TPA: NAD(P)/FAD-dependent oxidoreductase [Rhodothermales bacterium]|nr:NAD(P)/FAD-dependent oxidoreductase [Rhodothermales bacterium]